jgi:Methyltransferase domain
MPVPDCRARMLRSTLSSSCGLIHPMFSVAKPRITYSEDIAKAGVFRERFSALTDEEWLAIWLSTADSTDVGGLEFPAIPEQALQLQIHGSATWDYSMREAFEFYQFVKAHVPLNEGGSERFLDYGCGWGRMTRPFMRHYDQNKIFGFEPHLMLCAIARALNPYTCVLSGGFSPDGSIPKDWFSLIIGWSIFSHLSKASFTQWLTELSSTLAPGGYGVFTTWGSRFLHRLQAEKAELDSGKEIHWYSKVCIEAAGDLSARLAEYERGEFVWFTESGSADYGEAFISELALLHIVNDEALPLKVLKFDISSLAQDVFIVQRVRDKRP